ncbi:MAG: DUF4136 domain-containing protein [Coraliomargarita sp.]|nr:DUF4136 domain-containing protein [Coraliomargarita sp.]
MKKSFLALSLIGIAIALLSGCSSTPKPKTPKGSSSGYSTYRLYKELPSGTTHFVNREAEVHNILQGEINTVFTSNGLQESGDDAELIVAYLVLVQNNAVSTGISDYYINSGSEIVQYAHKKIAIDQNFSSSFEAGTLVIDVIDAQKRKLIYRNHSSKQIREDLPLAERNKRVKDAVDESLAQFFR